MERHSPCQTAPYNIGFMKTFNLLYITMGGPVYTYTAKTKAV